MLIHFRHVILEICFVFKILCVDIESLIECLSVYMKFGSSTCCKLFCTPESNVLCEAHMYVMKRTRNILKRCIEYEKLDMY